MDSSGYINKTTIMDSSGYRMSDCDHLMRDIEIEILEHIVSCSECTDGNLYDYGN